MHSCTIHRSMHALHPRMITSSSFLQSSYVSIRSRFDRLRSSILVLSSHLLRTYTNAATQRLRLRTTTSTNPTNAKRNNRFQFDRAHQRSPRCPKQSALSTNTPHVSFITTTPPDKHESHASQLASLKRHNHKTNDRRTNK